MEPAANVYEIDPRRFPGDRFYTGFLVLFWIVWTPITLFVTGFAGSGEGPEAFLMFWLCFGWLGVLLIPWILLTRNRPQRLEASGGRLVVVGGGLLPWTRREIPHDGLRALTLERHDEESVWTLNLFTRGGLAGRVMLAPMVHPDAKEQLFGEIAAFLREQGFDFEARNERKPAVPQPLY